MRFLYPLFYVLVSHGVSWAESPDRQQLAPRTKVYLNGASFDYVLLSFSPDGKMLAATGSPPLLSLWNPATGKKLLDDTGYFDNTEVPFVDAVDFAPAENILGLIANPQDQKGTFLEFWNMATHKRVNSFKLDWYPEQICFSPDGKSIAVAHDPDISIIERCTGKRIKHLKDDKEHVKSMVYSPDGKTLYSAGYNQVIKAWDLGTGKPKQILRGHKYTIQSLALSGDGKVLLSADIVGKVNVWNLAKGEQRAQFDRAGQYVAFAPDEQFAIAVGGRYPISVIDLARGKVTRQIEITWSGARGIAVDPQRKTLAVGCDRGELLFWDTATLLGKQSK